jgi:hypothetical protein
LLIGTAILAVAVSLCGGLFFVIEAPRFTRVPISSPISYLPNGDWGQKDYIVRIYQGEYNREFILRMESFAYGSAPDRNLTSADGVMQYFSSNLGQFGWDLAHPAAAGNCTDVVPEVLQVASMCPLAEFVRKGEQPEQASERICLAIIPEDWPLGEVYRVVFVTRRYSPLTEFLRKSREW